MGRRRRLLSGPKRRVGERQEQSRICLKSEGRTGKKSKVEAPDGDVKCADSTRKDRAVKRRTNEEDELSVQPAKLGLDVNLKKGVGVDCFVDDDVPYLVLKSWKRPDKKSIVAVCGTLKDALSYFDAFEAVSMNREKQEKKKHKPVLAKFRYQAIRRSMQVFALFDDDDGFHLESKHEQKFGLKLRFYFQSFYSKRYDSFVSLISIKNEYLSPERQDWFLPLPVTVSIGVMDTVVYLKLSAEATKIVLHCFGDRAVSAVHPEGVSASIIGLRVRDLVSEWTVCKAIMLVGNQQHNLAEVLTIAVRHKVAVLVHEFKSVKTSSSVVMRKADDGDARQGKVNDGLKTIHFAMWSSRPPPDPMRLGWAKWPLPEAGFDKHYLAEMQEFRKAKRAEYIRARGIRPDEVESKLKQLLLLHYFLIMHPSQGMRDEVCRSVYYTWITLGYHDVQSFISALGDVSYERLVKHYANVYASTNCGMQVLRAKSLIDCFVCFYLFYDSQCPTDPGRLLCLDQIGEKKVKVTLNAVGIEAEVGGSAIGVDSLVKKMFKRWGVEAWDICPDVQGFVNDTVGEICQQLDRGGRDSIRWVIDVLSRAVEVDSEVCGPMVDEWRRAYQNKLNERVNQAKREYNRQGKGENDSSLREWYEYVENWLNA